MGSDKEAKRAVSRIMRDLRHLTTEDLLTIRIADKSASGVPGKEVKPEFVARVREVIAMLRAENRAFTVTDLEISGKELIRELGMKPGPDIGRVLKGLLDDVVEEVVPNERAALLSRAGERVRSLDVARG